MNLREALDKATQILDEERTMPTVSYRMVGAPVPQAETLYLDPAVYERHDARPRQVRENPASVQFKSGNFDLLSTLLDQLVDSQGKTIKDLGAATPLVVMDRQLSPGTVTPEMQSKIDLVGQGKMDLPTALRAYIRYPGMADAFTNALYQKYPDFNQATYGVSKDTLKYFTTGAGASQLTAFLTAIAHADLLQQAAQALNNGDSRTFNSITNRLQSEFGDPRLTTFDAIANAYNHEVSQVVSKGHITDKEVSAGGATMPSNANFQTIQSVTNAYKQLMGSKAQNLMVQYEQGRKGQPAFPEGVTTNGQSGFLISIGNKHYQYKGAGATDDLRNYSEVQ